MFTWILIGLLILLSPTPLFMVLTVPFMLTFVCVTSLDRAFSDKPVTSLVYTADVLYCWGRAMVNVLGVIMAGILIYVGVVVGGINS